MRLPVVVRGLGYRRGSTAAMLTIAAVGCAAAALAPTYDAAAKTSIMRDTVSSASVIERGFEVREQGSLAHVLDPLSATVDRIVASTAPSGDRPLFASKVEAVEATAYFSEQDQSAPLIYRSDLCAHLTMLAGKCELSTGVVMVSESLAKLNGWQVLQRITPSGWSTFTISGIYHTPDPSAAYWFDQGNLYFPAEYPASIVDVPPIDAVFTSQDTIESATGYHSAIDTVDELINQSTLRTTDLPKLTATVTALSNSQDLIQADASAESSMQATVDQVRSSWHSLSVPVVLITAQTLLLVWLLLFVIVTEAIDARGRDIALAKLRGYGRRRVLGVAVSEPAVVLVLAWPLGLVLAWFVSHFLVADLLRAGTPTGLTALSWLIALLGTVGGVAAVSVGGRRAVRRPIVEEWRRVGQETTRRGWIVDSVALTAAAAALLELRLGGSGTPNKSLVLLVPGLLGIAVAVVGSRVLPLVCRALFEFTARGGSLAVFLAVRHVARRPTGLRAVTAMAAAFTLTSFGLASYATGHANRALVAEVSNGAPAVMTVDAKAGSNLGTVVAGLDPSRTQAMVVDQYLNPTGSGRVLLGIDPQPFAKIASWRSSFAAKPLADVLRALDPSAPPPVIVDGDALRVRLDVRSESQPLVLAADLTVADQLAPIYANLGTITQTGAQVSLAATVTDCPCQLLDLSVSTTVGPGRGAAVPVQPDIVVNGLDERKAGTWVPVAAGTDDAHRWRTTVGDHAPLAVSATSQGLQWSAGFMSNQVALLQPIDRPDPIPVVIGSTGAAALSGTGQLTGLNGRPLAVVGVASAVVLPGAPTGGVLIDRAYAESAAGGNLTAVQQQVWTTGAVANRIHTALVAAGFHVGDITRAAAQTRVLQRQGPGLASILFLGDSVAAAILAAGVAIAGLAFATRRRRYEYAALEAVGERRSRLFLGLFLEQSMVLLFGALIGIGAGLVAARVVSSSIPVFVTKPAGVPLSYSPSLSALTPTLLGSVGVLLCVAALTSWRLLAGVRPDQLREAAS
ncbi:MAG TPA: ABC transporter permease [Acidothermaceae bacterium]